MNEVAALNSIKSLINTNKATLVDGLVHQGEQREIEQITISTLTPPNEYYFISIYTDRDEDTNREGFGRTTRLAPTTTNYSMIIELVDYAVIVAGEEEQYETMDSDFKKLCDRVVKLLRASAEITYTDAQSNNFIFRLDNTRSVIKENLTDVWTEAEGYASMLYCRISFNLLDECTDDSTLYES